MKTLKERIEATELLVKWIDKLEITYASEHGNGSQKQLKIDMHGNFMVYDHGRRILKTSFIGIAIETYGELL